MELHEIQVLAGDVFPDHIPNVIYKNELPRGRYLFDIVMNQIYISSLNKKVH